MEDHRKDPKTEGYRNLEANLEQLMGLMEIFLVELKRLPLKSLEKRVSRQLAKTPNAKVKLISRAISDFSASVEKYVQTRSLIQNWMSVILVAFVEDYLEQGLVLITKKNPRLLKSADPTNYERIFEADSIEDLRTDLRQQWAKQTLQGGPKKWLKRLRDMGAQGYKKDCDFRMQHLWDTRNLIVHAQGIANHVYLRRLKNSRLKPGDRVRISTELLGWWLEGIRDFVEPTEQFFLSYGQRSRKASV